MSLADSRGFDPSQPIELMKQEDLEAVLHGSQGKRIQVTHKTRRGRRYRWNTKFEGVINNLQRRHIETESDSVRKDIERYMTSLPCQPVSYTHLTLPTNREV